MLPSKMAPKMKCTKSTTRPKKHKGSSTHPKKKSLKATVEEVEDEDSPDNIFACNRASAELSQSSSAAHKAMTSIAGKGKKVCFFTTSVTLYLPGAWKSNTAKWNPVYLFYELVSQNASGQTGEPGDKHYKCYHDNRKVLTVMKLMKSNLNGLISFLMLEMVS